jgi:hydroxymethylpyrimidine/phosphomethylpyrimidine kinase
MSPNTAAPVVRRPAVALSVGELDPSGRTGVLVDLRVFSARATHGACVVTFLAGTPVDPTQVAAEFESARGALPIDTIKVGRLGGERATRSAVEWLAAARARVQPTPGAWVPPVPRLVVDASLLDAYGEPRVSDKVVAAWKQHLVPLAEVACMNVVEAQRLFGRPVESRRAMLDAAKRLFDFGAPFVVVTGGRLDGHPVDLLYDGTGTLEVGMDRVPGVRLPHTGGVLSAALAAGLARGETVPEALESARPWVNEALLGATDLVPFGRAVEPMRTLWSRDRTEVEVVSVAVPRAPESMESKDST